MVIRKLVFLSLLLDLNHSYAQVNIPDGFLNRLDKSDTSKITFYGSIDDSNQEKVIQLLDPFIKASFNSAYPRGYNDGPVWKGRGITTEIHAGISGKKGNLSYTLFPVAYFSQNSSFELSPHLEMGLNPFRYQYLNYNTSVYPLYTQIDWVQQYGNDLFINIHPGQSQVKLQLGKFISSISTQNYSIGPSIFNPITLSRQGAGFPHLRFGSEPLDLNIKNFSIGKLESNFLIGLLKESQYFDNNAENNNQYFNGLFVGFTPALLPNLKLGFNKVLYKNAQFFEAVDLISAITVLSGAAHGDSLTNDSFDQMVSATAEWNFPEVGFRAYGEFAKNDFGGLFRWTALEPEHSRAYTVGFEKNTRIKNGDLINIIYEHTNLSRNHTYLWRPEPPFYMHHINVQGYTHAGQLLGAGIGPGSNTDVIGIKYINGDRIFGLTGQRIEFNKDYFVVNIQNVRDHDVEYSGGLYFQQELSKQILSLESIISHNYNRHYLDNRLNFYIALSTMFRL